MLATMMVFSLAACSSEESSSTEEGSTEEGGTEEEAEGEESSEEEEAEEPAENDYFESLNADEVNITGAETYTVKLQAKEGWQFDVEDNSDVTDWFVDKKGDPVFSDKSGIAFAKNAEDFGLDITIDASKITGFVTNGPVDIYVSPTGGNPLVVEGDNHGQYTDVSLYVGAITIPKVTVEGTIEGESGEEYTFSEDTVTVKLEMDGIDDSLIDSSNSEVTLQEGDGYYLSDYEYAGGKLTGSWSNGETEFTLTTDEFNGDFSPLGGDGNGNYYANIGVSGIVYNGLPLGEGTFRVHVYSYGRTFEIESNGSLIDSTQPKFTTTTEGGKPILCDAYPDTLTVTWPVTFDASKLTTDDVTLTLCGDYGDELVLEPETDYTVESSTDKTEITVTYIYWANIPVYTTMKVDIATKDITYNEEMYTVGSTISYTYDIASVYSYYIMSGGMEGTQKWTYYGVDGLEDWAQAFVIPTYTLTYTNEDGSVSYYTEKDGKGEFTDAADDAEEFDATEDNNCQVVDNTGSFERVYDQTQDVTVDGKTYTCDKVYANADNMPLDPEDCTGITAKPGYVLGDSWEMHGRWPWQTFIGTGYQGGHG